MMLLIYSYVYYMCICISKHVYKKLHFLNLIDDGGLHSHSESSESEKGCPLTFTAALRNFFT